MTLALTLMDRGLLPDAFIRFGIRRLLRERLRQHDRGDGEARHAAFQEMLATMRDGPIAVDTVAANEQHYEVPAEFFRTVLGERLKYSCAYWGEGVNGLDEAEEAMLDLTCRRAGIRDGMDVLDLGCGWGSLSLWIAERYPTSRVTAVSNSRSQAEFIRSRAERTGLRNVRVLTADMNDFEPDRKFHRIVSVEMFEHMRNVEMLLGRIRHWLRPDGFLFVHVFCHHRHPYFFEVDGEDDWMAKHFFTGGYMPSEDLFLYLQKDMTVADHWSVNGRHYEKTLLAWLAKMDASRHRVMDIFRKAYGEDSAETWFQRWRVFFMACAETFGYGQGREWFVSHYLFRPRERARAGAES